MKVVEFVKECGAAESDITLKTDQELVIEAQMAGAEESGEKERDAERDPWEEDESSRDTQEHKDRGEEKGRGR